MWTRPNSSMSRSAGLLLVRLRRHIRPIARRALLVTRASLAHRGRELCEEHVERRYDPVAGARWPQDAGLEIRPCSTARLSARPAPALRRLAIVRACDRKVVRELVAQEMVAVKENKRVSL